MKNNKISKDKIIHFCGIGGVGMNPIALLKNKIGYKNIQGSNLNESSNLNKLKESDIKVYIGHDKDNVKNIDLLVKSTAIPETNPEIVYAKQLNIPIIHRSEALSSLISHFKTIAIAGCHGKTTLSSLFAYGLNYMDFPCNAVVGGEIGGFNSGIVYDKNAEWIVIESDESDGTLVNYNHNIAVITNIEADHMDTYNQDEQKLLSTFLNFSKNQLPNGTLLLGIDSDMTRNSLLPLLIETNINYTTYGFHEDAEYRIINDKYNSCNSELEIIHKGNKIGSFKSNLLGKHGISNSAAFIIITKMLNNKIENKQISDALLNFKGVGRRFTEIDNFNDIVFIDDYAHHPTEIKATLESANQIKDKYNIKRNIAVFQPHRYSRLNDLMDEFALSFKDADKIILLDVFSCGEKEIEGINSQALLCKIKNSYPTKEIILYNNNLKDLIKEQALKNDIWIFMGAGDISQKAYKAVAEYKTLI